MISETFKSGLIGFLTGGRIAKKDFGGKKVQELQLDIDEDAMIQVPMYLMKGIAENLPYVDLTKEVKVGVYKNKKGKTNINISQEEVAGSDDWKALPTHYTDFSQDEATKKWTATSKNGIPSPTFDDDDEAWDFSAHDKFLKAEIRKFFEDSFGEGAIPAQTPAPVADGVDETPVPF
jgi:hypothetical protein